MNLKQSMWRHRGLGAKRLHSTPGPGGHPSEQLPSAVATAEHPTPMRGTPGRMSFTDSPSRPPADGRVCLPNARSSAFRCICRESGGADSACGDAPRWGPAQVAVCPGPQRSAFVRCSEPRRLRPSRRGPGRSARGSARARARSRPNAHVLPWRVALSEPRARFVTSKPMPRMSSRRPAPGHQRNRCCRRRRWT